MRARPARGMAETLCGCYRAKAHLMLNIWGGNSFFQIS